MSLQIKDVMVSNLVTLEVKASVKKAAELMDKHDIGCLIAVSHQKPVGIITERDMLKRVLLQKKDLVETKVGDIMSMPLISSPPQTDLRDAVSLMNDRKIKRLLVIENGNLIGLLSLSDVMRSLAYFEHVISALCQRCQLGK